MDQKQFDKLDARITALFFIQAQAFAMAATANCGAGNEQKAITRYRASALEAAKDWPENIRAEGTKAVADFFDLLGARG